MSLPHAAPGQVINIRPLNGKLRESVSTALFKASELEVMRLVLEAGKEIPEHRVAGEITIHCLEGAIELRAHDRTQTLRQGEMVYLAGNEPYSLRAVDDASVLMTVSLKRNEEGSASAGIKS
jgi:quercetin dioxygenase-like cupin family protein